MKIMRNDERQDVVLSEICCQCLKIIQDVAYANAYTFYWSQNYKAVQKSIRSISPKVQQEGDWVRIRFKGMAFVFSISDEAIKFYRPIIQEFQCFSSAVRILGVYESHVRRIVELSKQRIPNEMDRFRSNHNKLIRTDKSFWSDKLGRGIDFLQEVFDWNPSPRYRPGLQLMFHLRNLTVHNAGIADQRLCQLANNPHVELIGELKVGDKVSWNLGTNLQLQHLVIAILTDADPYVAKRLGLPKLKKRAFWREDNTLNA